MKFIDTHVHLQDFIPENVKDIITSSLMFGIEKIICVGTKQEDWSKVADLYDKYPNYIIPAFGLHPYYIKDANENWSLELEVFFKKYPNALVGEVGLSGNKSFEGQAEAFELQLNLAKKYNRKVIIHAVQCQNWFEQNWDKISNNCVFHSYNGNKEFLKQIILKKCYVSFSFSILNNKDCLDIVNMVPLNRILIETDSPYQSPDKNRSNEPSSLPKLANDIARILNFAEKDFVKKVYKNSLEFIKVE